MNADISYNARVANQSALLKGQFVAEAKSLCEKLSIEIPKVHASDVKPQASENNIWLAVQIEKLRRINIAVDALETA